MRKLAPLLALSTVILVGVSLSGLDNATSKIEENQARYFEQHGRYEQIKNEEVKGMKAKVDVYESPKGHGYTITIEKEEDGYTYRKVINKGPLKDRARDWYVIASPPTNSGSTL